MSGGKRHLTLITALALLSSQTAVAQGRCEGEQTDHGFYFFEPFTIFFDWDSATIAPPAAAILDNAVRVYAGLREQPNFGPCVIVIPDTPTAPVRKPII